MNKLRPPDFPGRNLPGRIRRGIPQKIRTGIGIPEKLPIFADTISHESGSAAGGPDFGFHTGCNEKRRPAGTFHDLLQKFEMKPTDPTPPPRQSASLIRRI